MKRRKNAGMHVLIMQKGMTTARVARLAAVRKTYFRSLGRLLVTRRSLLGRKFTYRSKT